MRTIEIYKFNELSKDIQDKVIEEHHDINVDYVWYDFIIDDAKRIGINIMDFDINNNNIKGEITKNIRKVINNIKNEYGDESNLYQIANDFQQKLSTQAHIFSEKHNLKINDFISDEQVSEWKNIEKNITRDFERLVLRYFLNILKKEYEYLTSREAIVDTLLAHDYDFTKEGRKILLWITEQYLIK